MESVQHILKQIIIRHNLISHFILLGVFQGCFIGTIILVRTFNKKTSLKLLGFFLIIHSIVLFDTYSCYTGIIKNFIHFNDTTEPLVLLWGPLIYFFIKNVLDRELFVFKNNWMHFLLPFTYFLTQIEYYLQDISVKTNAYLSAYYPNANRAFEPEGTTFHYQIVKDEIRWLILFSFVFYLGLSLKVLLKNSKKSKFKKNEKISKYQFSKNTLFIFTGLVFIILFIFTNFETDLGDHYIAILQSVIVFVISFMMLSESRFFENSWIADKYETSKVENSLTIYDVKNFIETENYYLLQTASLKDLSKNFEVNTNSISKIINAETNLNFNDFINQYRIKASKKQLLDANYKHLTIEAIGNSVGFKSKSAFYSAFKKCTNTSPSAFIKAQKTS